MTTVLLLNEIKEPVDIPQLIEDIEAGFALYSQGRVQVPPLTGADLTGVAIQDIQIAAMVNRAFLEKQTP